MMQAYQLISHPSGDDEIGRPKERRG